MTETAGYVDALYLSGYSPREARRCAVAEGEYRLCLVFTSIACGDEEDRKRGNQSCDERWGQREVGVRCTYTPGQTGGVVGVGVVLHFRVLLGVNFTAQHKKDSNLVSTS